jgi:hypothetical protein
MITEAAHGTSSAQRTRRRPAKSSFRSWAIPSETSTVAATIDATHITVLATTGTKASCSTSRA